MTDEAPLDANVVARILRRATDLERMGEVDHPTDGITETSLIAAAEEVGLSVEAVRRSIAYERLGPMPQPRRGDRLLGPAHVYADDEIGAPADEALARIDAWLVDGHHLRRDALRPGHGVWSKRSGIVGVTARTIRGATGEGKLGNCERVDATARDIAGGSSLVRVLIDRSNHRRFAGGGGAAVAVGGMTGVAIAAAVATPLLLVAMPVAVVAGLRVAMTGRKRAGATQREIQRVLEAVGNGAEPTRLSVDVVRRASGRATAVGSGALRAVGRVVPPLPPPVPLDPIRMRQPPTSGDATDR